MRPLGIRECISDCDFRGSQIDRDKAEKEVEQGAHCLQQRAEAHCPPPPSLNNQIPRHSQLEAGSPLHALCSSFLKPALLSFRARVLFSWLLKVVTLKAFMLSLPHCFVRDYSVLVFNLLEKNMKNLHA